MAAAAPASAACCPAAALHTSSGEGQTLRACWKRQEQAALPDWKPCVRCGICMLSGSQVEVRLLTTTVSSAAVARARTVCLMSGADHATAMQHVFGTRIRLCRIRLSCHCCKAHCCINCCPLCLHLCIHCANVDRLQTPGKSTYPVESLARARASKGEQCGPRFVSDSSQFVPRPLDLV